MICGRVQIDTTVVLPVLVLMWPTGWRERASQSKQVRAPTEQVMNSQDLDLTCSLLVSRRSLRPWIGLVCLRLLRVGQINDQICSLRYECIFGVCSDSWTQANRHYRSSFGTGRQDFDRIRSF